MALPSATVSSTSDGAARGLRDRLCAASLEGVLQSIGDGVIVEDATGVIVWANEAAAHLVGAASAAELSGRALGAVPRELTDEARRPLDGAQLPAARLLRGEPAEPVVVRLRDLASGSVAWATVSASLVRLADARPPLAASIWRDVTEERRRREAASYLARATDVLSESLDYTATLKRLARVLVPELCDWFCADVIEGGELRTIAVEHADAAQAQLARELHARVPPRLDDAWGLGAVARTGRPELINGVDHEALARTMSGDDRVLALVRALRPRSMLIVPLRSCGREQTFGAMKLLSGCSGRRYDETDLAMAEELGRRVGIAIENARAYREAREAIRLRDEFLAVAGHELRTPLTALKLQLQAVAAALRRGQVTSDPEAFARRMDHTVAHADRLQQLIDRVLDVSHIASRRIVLDREDVDLAELWRDVIARHATEAGRACSAVSFTTTGRTVGQWDRARIDQVLTSLLGNALKYGAGKPVRVSVHGADGAVTTTVRDEGVGIDLSAQSRIFGRFERAMSLRNYGGFGLGLWIVRELVEAHGGAVGFESQPGRGSTFRVELPCAPPPT